MADSELKELNPEDVAAAYLGLSVRTLRQGRWHDETALDCYLPAHIKVGRRVYYTKEDLEACLEGRLQHPKLAAKYQKRREEHECSQPA